MCLEISEYFGADCLICSPQAGLEKKPAWGFLYSEKERYYSKKEICFWNMPLI